MSEDFEAWEETLWAVVSAQFHGGPTSVHGPSHWRRVRQNALLLARRTGADALVVRLFALFHDARRVNECHDPGHGARGAAYANEIRTQLPPMDDRRFALLHQACTWHTDKDFSSDPTIGSCWDADRLDLGRVGIIPSEALMSTAFGKEIARAGSIFPFLDRSGEASDAAAPI